ncbi:MAG: hypothetical protein ACM30G_10865 [Micromonosporaceae bacterium]
MPPAPDDVLIFGVTVLLSDLAHTQRGGQAASCSLAILVPIFTAQLVPDASIKHLDVMLGVRPRRCFDHGPG